MSLGPVAEAVGRVEAELNAFWSTPDIVDSGPVAKARASTLTFVAAGTHAEVERLEAQAEELADTHAGRALLITVDGRLPPWELKAEWSATCRRGGEVPICRDRVELAFGAMAAERVASVVGALAISDVPLIVEAAPGAPPVVADALAEIADRLIIDSAELPPIRVAELARSSHGPIADRAFVRTFSWRELTARFFDEAPGAWRSIRKLQIARTSGPHTDPAALLVGWLGARLGWTFEARDRARDAAGRAVEIALEDTGPGADAGGRRRIDAIRISTEHRGAPLSLECARIDTGSAVRWSMQGAISITHVHPLGYRDEAWVLVKAIDATEGDRVLHDASLAAATWSAL